MAIISSGKQGEFFDELEIMPTKKREEYLAKRLQQTVNYAYRNAPSTKEIFDRAKVSPSEIRTIKDLEKLPITRKTDLIELQKANHPTEAFLPFPLKMLSAYLSHQALSMSHCTPGLSNGSPNHSTPPDLERETLSLIPLPTTCHRLVSYFTKP